MDTIYAPSTARGKAGIAVVRISGERALLAVCEAFGVEGLQARRASLRHLRHGEDLIDDAVVIYFPKGESFTDEDVVELHVHGSPAVVKEVLRILGRVDGLRLADAGEFTRRALMNGRMDLTQVEGLADLLEAETQMQRYQAQRVMSGAIGQRVEKWRKDLIRALALIEAIIDFADEDIPVDVLPEVQALTAGVIADFQDELQKSCATERVRNGFEVAIVGEVNTGKSSLLNALSGRDAALVSNVEGTTRDVIEVHMDIKGLPVTLLDTAGIRSTEDVVESMGIARTHERAQSADLRVFLLDAQKPSKDAAFFDPLFEKGDIVLRSKADIYPETGDISAKTGAGINDLLSLIHNRLMPRVPTDAILVRERHKNALEGAQKALVSVVEYMHESPENAVEFISVELRSALFELEVLVGRVDAELLLDEIFASFCIGK